MLRLLLAIGIVSIIVFSATLVAARGPLKPPPTNVQVTLTVPNGAEQFKQGTANTITWQGGKNVVALGLVKPEADTSFDIASTGMIIGWITTNEGPGYYLPNSSATWNALQVCNFSLNPDPDTGCQPVQPGNYKILVWSQNDDGSMYIGTGTGPSGKYTKKDLKGNWDLSDQVFTISAQ